jgi:hypothetical protein
MRTELETAQAVTVHIDGKAVAVNTTMSVAAAMVQAGTMCSRRSVSGEARFALCGMGVCQECRVSIDGVEHCLACQARCREGMVVVTAALAPE